MKTFLLLGLLAGVHAFHEGETTDRELERHLAKSIKKAEAKSTKLAALEKSPASPAKPFFYPFAPLDKDAVAKYQEAYAKYWASISDNTKALYSNPMAWLWFWPQMMYWPWMWFYWSWAWMWPWAWMMWWW